MRSRDLCVGFDLSEGLVAMKKLINRPEAVVEEMIEGLVAVYPGLERLPGQTVVVRADAAEVRDRRVALISGAAAGTSRRTRATSGGGCSSAAVAGDVFTSPSPDAVLAAIRAVTGPPGALLDRQELHGRPAQLRARRRDGPRRGATRSRWSSSPTTWRWPRPPAPSTPAGGDWPGRSSSTRSPARRPRRRRAWPRSPPRPATPPPQSARWASP